MNSSTVRGRIALFFALVVFAGSVAVLVPAIPTPNAGAVPLAQGGASGGGGGGFTASATDGDGRIAALEARVTALEARLTALESAPPAAASAPFAEVTGEAMVLTGFGANALDPMTLDEGRYYVSFDCNGEQWWVYADTIDKAHGGRYVATGGRDLLELSGRVVFSPMCRDADWTITIQPLD